MHSFYERSFGDIFKETRAAKKISIAEAQAETRVRRKFLEAIEEENFSFLPNIVAAKGFIRIYSDYLGLDSKSLIEKFLNIVNRQEIFNRKDGARWVLLDFSKTGGIFQLKYALPVFPVLFIALIFYYSFGHFKKPVENKNLSPLVVEAPKEEFVTKKVASATENVLLSADFVDKTWISVELDGKEAFTGIVGRGQKMFWEAENRIKIKAGNAGGVKIAVNEKSLGPLGAKGMVVEKEFSR